MAECHGGVQLHGNRNVQPFVHIMMDQEEVKGDLPPLLIISRNNLTL